MRTFLDGGSSYKSTIEMVLEDRGSGPNQEGIHSFWRASQHGFAAFDMLTSPTLSRRAAV
jgi:hypothetical protein